MKPIRVERSFVAADALAEVIAEEYDFGDNVTCKLFSKMLRSQDNDHYLVLTGDQKYVARIYQIGRYLARQATDYQFELDWLTHLKTSDCPVAYPIPRKDGGQLGSVLAPEGKRYYAVFSFADGETMDATDVDQLFTCGAAMARIHLASHDFKTDNSRATWDLTYLVDKPIERIKRNWSQARADDFDLLMASAHEAREQILELLDDEKTPDKWGVIGGDFHASNTFFDDEGNISFINFDLCGYGWYAYDIAVFLLNSNLLKGPVELSEAFFAGYFSERPLAEEEHESISAFMTLRRVWLTGFFAMGSGFAGTTFVASV